MPSETLGPTHRIERVSTLASTGRHIRLTRSCKHLNLLFNSTATVNTNSSLPQEYQSAIGSPGSRDRPRIVMRSRLRPLIRPVPSLMKGPLAAWNSGTGTTSESSSFLSKNYLRLWRVLARHILPASQICQISWQVACARTTSDQPAYAAVTRRVVPTGLRSGL